MRATRELMASPVIVEPNRAALGNCCSSKLDYGAEISGRQYPSSIARRAGRRQEAPDRGDAGRLRNILGGLVAREVVIDRRACDWATQPKRCTNTNPLIG